MDANHKRSRDPVEPHYQLVSVKIKNRYDFQGDSFPLGYFEWKKRTGKTIKTSSEGIPYACIKMRDKLSMTITLQRTDAQDITESNLKLKFKLTLNTNLPQDITASGTISGNTIQYEVDTNVVVSSTINDTKVRLSTFKLETSNGTEIDVDEPTWIDLTIYTIFGLPLSDNVKENTLVGPGVNPNLAKDEVLRLRPFFSYEHVEQACAWAKGTSRLGTKIENQDIIYTVIRNIPDLEYGKDDRYFLENDGWNVWDNLGKSTGDCSQQASFFADVLGVLGVRAHDFEIKCEYIKDGKRYRRYFGEKNPDDWPTHGVVLVRYGPNDFYCYDTTFSDPRLVTTLDDALKVGTGADVPFIKPGWQHWYYIPDDDPNDVQDIKTPGLEATLTSEFPQDKWQQQMKTLADTRFPQSEIQPNPGL